MSKRSAFKDLLRTLADAGLLEFGSVIKRAFRPDTSKTFIRIRIICVLPNVH